MSFMEFHLIYSNKLSKIFSKIMYLSMRTLTFSLLFLTLMIPRLLLGQDTVFMGTNNHQSIVSNYCIVYTDNGPGQPHSPRVNSSYTIKATNPDYNCKIIMRSEYDYYCNPVNSYFIYDGDTNSEELIIRSYGDVYYNHILYTELNNGEITIKFTADNDNPPESFEIIVQFCDCEAPSNITHEYIDSSSVVLRWDGHGYSSFAIDYITYTPENSNGALTGYPFHLAMPNNASTIYSNTDSVLITGLPPYSFIHYNVYGTCDSVPMCGILGNTNCRNFPPENIEVTYDEDSIYMYWDSVPNANWYILVDYYGNYIQTNNNHYSLPKVCNDYADIRVLGSYSGCFYCGYSYVLSKYLGCPNVYGGVSHMTPNSMKVWWMDIDTIDYYVVKCTYSTYPYNTVFIDTIPRGVGEVTIDGLYEATEYNVSLYTLCEECGISTGTYYSATTTLNRCIDYINVYSSHVWPTFGYYDDPYQYSGGFRGGIFVDTSFYDYYTNNLLRQIPEGEKASIKLGNASAGAEAESISYDYFVDTNQFDMLTLKYAVVLQNPDHTLENQPRFTLEILDSSGALIDTTCAFADFYASGDLGWNQNTYNNSTIIWKDWTTVGVDIAPYHGQDIKIRLTTYDCKEGGHFGYAYFTLNCDKKRIYLFNRCDAQDTVHLQAPLGFEYQWYRASDTTVISTNYDILVPIDSNEYNCLASFVGKPECNFIVSSHTISIVPKSEATFTIDTCSSNVFLQSQSYVALDTTYNVFTNHIIDSVFWILDDDSIFIQDTLSRHYPNNGLYDIKLVSTLSDSYCTDTLTIPVNIDFNLLAGISGPDTICQRDTMTLQGIFTSNAVRENLTFLWNTQETNDSITHVATQTADWSLTVTENESCRGTARKTVVVNPSYYDTIYASICDNQTYIDEMFNTDSAGTYTWYSQTELGCDSLTTLILTVNPTHETLIFDTICFGENYTQNGFDEHEAGLYILNLQNIYGCDSIVKLNLHVKPSYSTTIDAAICDNETYSLNGFSETTEGVYVHTFQNMYGCDSIITLNLTVNPTYEYTIPAEICQGDTYIENNFFESEAGIYTQHLQTINGCDSIVHLELIVNPIYNDTIYSQLCGIPYDDNNFYETESGIYTQYLQTINGCDSIVTLNLDVWDLFTDSLYVEMYSGDVYNAHGFSESSTGDYVQVYTDVNGCDSTYFLHLDVINLKFPNVVTANGDGINDVFEIIGLLDNTYFSETELSIYTRHGRRVYLKENIKHESEFWSPAATNSPSGTYFFRFKAQGKTRIFDFNGTIEVLR